MPTASEPALVELVEGVGMPRVQLLSTTAEDVRATFGMPTRTISHASYSRQLVYERHGLSLYYCVQDPARRIFYIEAQAPFRARTSRGVVLGQHTLEQAFEIYGPSSCGSDSHSATSWCSYPGVEFRVLKAGEDDLYTRTITRIDILPHPHHTCDS